MCKESQTKPKQPDGRYYVIDHANKQGDRDRPNPNRGVIGKQRAGSWNRRQPTARRKQSPACDGDK